MLGRWFSECGLQPINTAGFREQLIIFCLLENTFSSSGLGYYCIITADKAARIYKSSVEDKVTCRCLLPSMEAKEIVFLVVFVSLPDYEKTV